MQTVIDLSLNYLRLMGVDHRRSAMVTQDFVSHLSKTIGILFYRPTEAAAIIICVL